MAVIVTIGGVAQTTLQPGWRISATANGLDSFSGDILSLDASNRPAIDDVIVVTEPDYPGTGTMRIFGGVITTVTEKGFGGVGASVGIVTTVTAEDFNSLATRRMVYGSRPAETLKTRLIWLIASYLVDLGGGLPDVTLHGSQADGPTLLAHDYNYERLDGVFDALTTETDGYLWNIDYNEVLRMAIVGTDTAPFDIVDGVTTDLVDGDIEVTPTRQDYANRVLLRYDGPSAVTDTFTVGAGPQTDFNLSKIHLSNPGYLTLNGVPNVDMASNGWEVFESSLSPSGWLLRKISTTVGWTIEFTYTSQFQITAQADDAGEQAANGIWEALIEAQNISDSSSAQTIADAYLTQHKQVRKSIQWPTQARGLQPRQTQTMSVSKRNLSAAFLITEVNIQHIVGTIIRRTITAIEGVVLLAGAWRDTWKQMLSGGGSSTSSSGSVSITTLTGGRIVYQLTGEGITAQQSPTLAWVDVSPIQVRIDGSVFGPTGTVYIRLKTATAGITVAARLFNITTNASAGALAAAAQSTSYGSVLPFAVTIAPGVNFYKLQLLPGTILEDMYSFAWVEN